MEFESGLVILGWWPHRIGWSYDGNYRFWPNWRCGRKSGRGIRHEHSCLYPFDGTLPARVKRMDLEQLLRISDVVSLHCPLTADTRQLINRERLKLMKPTAFLLNTSRGGLVEEEALAEALNTGRIAGAGLDVLSKEPPPLENPLLQAKNCIITPHFAWATKAARARLLNVAVANVRSFLAGQPQNTVV